MQAPVANVPYAEAGTWEKEKFRAHSIGVNAVSWAPAVLPVVPAAAGAAQVAPALSKRLASAGSDNLVRLWRYAHRPSATVTDRRPG